MIRLENYINSKRGGNNTEKGKILGLLELYIKEYASVDITFYVLEELPDKPIYKYEPSITDDLTKHSLLDLLEGLMLSLESNKDAPADIVASKLVEGVITALESYCSEMDKSIIDANIDELISMF